MLIFFLNLLTIVSQPLRWSEVMPVPVLLTGMPKTIEPHAVGACMGDATKG